MQDKMIHIGGLLDPAALPAWLQCGLEGGVLRWMDPAQAMSALESGGFPSNGAELWWCYAAPWSQAGGHAPGAPGGASGAWMTLHRRLLRARARCEPTLRLVNVGVAPSLAVIKQAVQQATEAVAIAGHVADDLADDNVGHGSDDAAEVSTHEGSTPLTEAVDAMLSAVAEAEAQAADTLHHEVSAMLGHLHAWASPETWDLVEALDAASWGGADLPPARDELPPPSPKALANLAAMLRAGQQAPAREEALTQQAEHQQAALTAAHARREVALNEEHAASLAAMQALHTAETGALRAELARLESEHQATKASQAQDTERHQAELASLRAEHAAALNKAHVEHKSAVETLQAEYKAEQAEAQADAKAQLEQAQADAQAAIETMRSNHAAALEAAQGQLKEAKEEGELLLLQLHQVQEELEQLFLQAKDKEAVHQKALADAEAAANAAAKAAAEQSAKALATAQADAKTALEKARAEHKAAADKAQAEAKAALDKSQADAKATLDKATTAHQQEAAKLKEDAAAKAAERDQARKALADTQATLDKVRAEHKAALEATQGQLKEAQEEGELLLLQLHQVQEELEQIFLRGRDQEAAAAKAQSEAKAEIDKFKTEAAEQARKLHGAEKRQAELSDALDKTRAVLKACQAAIADAEVQANQMRASHDEETSRLQAALAKSQAEHQSQLEASRQALAEAAKAEAAERSQLAAQHASALAALQAQLSQARAAMDTIRAEALSAQQQAEQESAQLHQERTQLRQESTQLRQELEHARDAAARAEQALIQVQDTLETRTLELREQHHALLLELHRAHEDLEAAERSHEAALAQARAVSEEAARRVVALKRRLGGEGQLVEVDVVAVDPRVGGRDVPNRGWPRWVGCDAGRPSRRPRVLTRAVVSCLAGAAA
jgi:hypothetical protein